MIKVVLDTNFLVYCAKQKIDYNSEIDNLMKESYELAVVSPTLRELKKLSEHAKKLIDRNAAKLALKLLKFNKVKIIESRGTADKLIYTLGKKGNIVATLDKELKYKLSRVIVIQGRKKIAFA